MSIDLIFRLIGMIVFIIVGIYWGSILGQAASQTPGALSVESYSFIFGLVGALFGLILTPYLTIRPIKALRALLVRISAQALFSSLLGLIVGLIIAALLAFPISMLPSPFGNVLPFVGVVVFSYIGIAIFVMRQNDLFSVLTSLSHGAGEKESEEQSLSKTKSESRTILLDTSVIIDGRIADIARTGFLAGTLLIPRFVLAELQYIADSADSLRRQRGRRGMEVLSQLQKQSIIPVRLTDIDVEGVREVDDKLVILARQLRCPTITSTGLLNCKAYLF